MSIDLIVVASVITAATTILGVFWKLHLLLVKINDKIDSYDKTINDNTISILRMALLSDDIPILDRIEAGKKYLELGGNGYGKIVYNQLIKEVETEVSNNI